MFDCVFVVYMFVCFLCCFVVLAFVCVIALCLLPFCTLECVANSAFVGFVVLSVFVCLLFVVFV